MKKWIFTVLIYGLGFLLVYTAIFDYEWIHELFQSLLSNDQTYYMYVYIFLAMIPMIIMLLNFFVLRIRGNSTAFTLMNAMMFPIFVILMLMTRFVGLGGGLQEYFESFLEGDYWNLLWENSKIIFVFCGINLLAGIVISEAKTKGTYLAAEFTYLVTGIFLGMIAR